MERLHRCRKRSMPVHESTLATVGHSFRPEVQSRIREVRRADVRAAVQVNPDLFCNNERFQQAPGCRTSAVVYNRSRMDEAERSLIISGFSIGTAGPHPDPGTVLKVGSTSVRFLMGGRK